MLVPDQREPAVVMFCSFRFCETQNYVGRGCTGWPDWAGRLGIGFSEVDRSVGRSQFRCGQVEMYFGRVRNRRRRTTPRLLYGGVSGRPVGLAWVKAR
jgi:hypothetical protein